MQVEFDNFVGIFKDAFSEDFCNDAIELFEIAAKHGYVADRNNENTPEHLKNDNALHAYSGVVQMPDNPEVMEELNANLLDPGYEQFFKIFWSEIYAKYSEKYSILNTADSHQVYYNKIQKTQPCEGYHIWHYENGTRANCNRILTYILYLNDIEDGGETELLYQSMRIKPERGTLILFPAGFTHTHRGNPPLKGDKYIMTGWVEY
jgi:Rps23 Pro-64 3,4-dihydroxylase Tpa1-like proline 4-hydroxylase